MVKRREYRLGNLVGVSGYLMMVAGLGWPLLKAALLVGLAEDGRQLAAVGKIIGFYLADSIPWLMFGVIGHGLGLKRTVLRRDRCGAAPDGELG